MPANDATKTVFSRQDVSIMETKACYAGFLILDKLTLKHRLYEGGWSAPVVREVIRRHPGVGVLLYDPDLDKVLMVEQFRVGCLEDAESPWKLELVAGLIDSDETPEQVAIREALEEAGARIENLIPVSRYYLSPGSSNESMQIFCARIDGRKAPGIYGLDSEHEDIRTVLLERQDAEQAIRDGLIDNAMSIIALQWLSLNLDNVKAVLQGNIENPGSSSGL